MRGIGAVVVTHQSASTLDDCLARLRAAHGVHAIRVVDNASTDTTLTIVQRHAAADPRLKFIANPDNPGFAAACNQGAESLANLHASVSGRWLAFVNPDCLVEADTLARLRVHADESGGDMLVGAGLLDEAGDHDRAARRRDPDFAAMLKGMFDPRAQFEVDLDPQQILQPVDAVSGALVLLPRTLFERIGGFDTGYRLHAEDLDLCRRARAAGARVAVANDVRVVHVRGVSGRARPWFVEWHKHRGLLRYFRKFEAPTRGPLLRLLVTAAIWTRFPFALICALLRG
ncbi:MAG TPA: glycosyltransferase family 2 protein [Xanthomonadaceae bacterium]|nr:glycosyltransferase family 2 protein [Xanthomonadaceae bacterium]